MTRKEYRKQTRKFEPAETRADRVYMNEYTNVHHNYEYYNALVDLETAHTKMEENYFLVKDMVALAKEEKKEERKEHKHARKIVLECLLEQFKKEKKLNERITELKQILKNDARKNPSIDTVSSDKNESIEEVRAIIYDTLDLVLQMTRE